MGICNVRIICLSADTFEVLTYCCKPIPIFNNLTHLTIKSCMEIITRAAQEVSKDRNSRLFHGPLNRETDSLCKEDVVSYLSSSPVKVLKIFISDDKKEMQIELVKHFLETMQHLEQLVLYYDSSFDGDVEVSTQLQMLTRVASPKCKVQLISRNQSD